MDLNDITPQFYQRAGQLKAHWERGFLGQHLCSNAIECSINGAGKHEVKMLTQVTSRAEEGRRQTRKYSPDGTGHLDWRTNGTVA